ncbi:hypothetical protein SY88_22405 [Clostridiales bacterium PH28_bin88]|nr:hypothetical protein SY88_22405 [Clostridiales bacterium PH28_bin88]
MEFTGERLVPHLEHTAELFVKHMSRYLLAQSPCKGKRILDAGCGAGYGAAFLAANGARAVVGIDISPEAIAYARENFQAANLVFQVGDCCNLRFPDHEFDGVVAMEIIEHLDRYPQFLAEVKRVLKPGGFLLVSTPNKEVWSPQQPQPVNPHHVIEFTLDQFRQVLGRYFQEVAVFGQGFARPVIFQNLANLQPGTVHLVRVPIRLLPYRAGSNFYNSLQAPPRRRNTMAEIRKSLYFVILARKHGSAVNIPIPAGDICYFWT